MANKNLNIDEVVNSHRPKNIKYKYIFHSDDTIEKLMAMNFDIGSLDTINNDMLVADALEASYEEFGRECVAKAKVPTILDNGVILSEQLITKADKKLHHVGVGFFTHNNVSYVGIKFVYELFDIIEIFSLL